VEYGKQAGDIQITNLVLTHGLTLTSINNILDHAFNCVN